MTLFVILFPTFINNWFPVHRWLHRGRVGIYIFLIYKQATQLKIFQYNFYWNILISFKKTIVFYLFVGDKSYFVTKTLQDLKLF